MKGRDAGPDGERTRSPGERLTARERTLLEERRSWLDLVVTGLAHRDTPPKAHTRANLVRDL